VTDVFQLALAFIFVLVVPGFAATLAAFPRFNQLDITERLALSIGLSITIVVAMGLFLGYSTTLVALTGGISAYSLIYLISFVTVFCLIIWALRRASLAAAERREASRPEREMVLNARKAKSVRPESQAQGAVRPQDATARRDVGKTGKEYPPRRGG